MSMNLSEPLVSSEGNLDPIDGFVIFRLLQASAMQANDGKVLEEEIADYKRVIDKKGEHVISSDPLDLGMTLWTAHWFFDKEGWAYNLAERCSEQIYHMFKVNRYLEHNIKYRLAFREFGTCLGIQSHPEQISLTGRTINLKKYADAIIEQWVPHIEVSTSSLDDDFRPINKVMYATALIPGAFCSGYLGNEPEAISGE